MDLKINIDIPGSLGALSAFGLMRDFPFSYGCEPVEKGSESIIIDYLIWK